MRSKLGILVCVFSISTVLSVGAFAKEEGPCKQIKEACESAGFVKGQAKQGTGLWMDCVDPIMQGAAQPKNAAKPLPTVDAQVVSACKAKKPNFGQQHKK